VYRVWSGGARIGRARSGRTSEVIPLCRTRSGFVPCRAGSRAGRPASVRPRAHRGRRVERCRSPLIPRRPRPQSGGEPRTRERRCEEVRPTLLIRWVVRGLPGESTRVPVMASRLDFQRAGSDRQVHQRLVPARFPRRGACVSFGQQVIGGDGRLHQTAAAGDLPPLRKNGGGQSAWYGSRHDRNVPPTAAVDAW